MLTGLVEGEFVVPDFVVQELHQLSDSRDPLRRNRGRLGLQTLEEMRQIGPGVKLTYEEVGHLLNADNADEKLVELAQNTRTRLLTTDYNLAKVANIRNVSALNLIDAAQALKPVVLPGERLPIKIIKLGRETGQGVGYLDDGSMVVVENGSELVGTQANVEVTSIIQTVGGRLVFASPIQVEELKTPRSPDVQSGSSDL
jgi:uncharacterized protein YacL